VDGVPPDQRDAVVQGVLNDAFAVGSLKSSGILKRGEQPHGQTFFELLETDLVQAAALLGGGAAAPPEPPRRRLRWRV
jgi:hypothetical protein